jgi:hypothetical protein
MGFQEYMPILCGLSCNLSVSDISPFVVATIGQSALTKDSVSLKLPDGPTLF